MLSERITGFFGESSPLLDESEASAAHGQEQIAPQIADIDCAEAAAVVGILAKIIEDEHLALSPYI